MKQVNSRSCKGTKEGVQRPILFGAFQVTWPPRCIHHTETDWADLQASPADPRASCSLSVSHNTAVSHRQGRSENRLRESTQAEAGMVGWGGGGREGLQGGSWGPPFQFHSVFPNERKGREWCPLSPCHTGTFKKQPQWFLKWGVFSRDKKRGKEWVGEEFNCGPVWGTGSGRMATLAFVKDRASLLVLPLCVSLAPWNLRWAQAEKLHHWSFSGNSH